MTEQTTTDAYIQALLTAPIDLSSTERMLLKQVGEASQIMADYAKENVDLRAQLAAMTERRDTMWNCLREMRRQRHVRITDQTVWCESVSRRNDRREARNGHTD